MIEGLGVSLAASKLDAMIGSKASIGCRPGEQLVKRCHQTFAETDMTLDVELRCNRFARALRPHVRGITRGDMTMRKSIILAIALLVGGVTATVAQDVRYNFDSGADFSTYKTYRWVDIKGADHVNQLVEKQIRQTIEAELATKGLQKTDSDTADLYIGYQTAIGTEKQFTSYNTGWGGQVGAAAGTEEAWAQP